jgi:hypothetical protein
MQARKLPEAPDALAEADPLAAGALVAAELAALVAGDDALDELLPQAASNTTAAALATPASSEVFLTSPPLDQGWGVPEHWACLVPPLVQAAQNVSPVTPDEKRCITLAATSLPNRDRKRPEDRPGVNLALQDGR